MTQLHFPTALLIIGLLFLLMPAITWLILAKQSSRAVVLWCTGGAILGMGIMMIGMRSALPGWATYTLGNFLLILGGLTRIQSLRIEMQQPWQSSTTWLLAGLAILIFEIIRQVLADVDLRLQYGHSVYAAIFSYTAYIAWRYGKQNSNRNALSIAAVSLLLGLAFMARTVEVTLVSGLQDGVDSSYVNSLLAIAGILSAVISHLAYAGMKLEQTQVKLETAEHEYDSILRTTKDGFFVSDLGGHFLDVNQTFCQMLGRTREQLLSMCSKDVDARLAPEEIDAITEALKQSGFERFETCHKCSDGGQIDVEVSISYLPDMGGRLLGFVRDITARKQFQLELERRVLSRTGELATARAEAESANAVKTRFMSNVSHEMRTPLQGILGFAELGKIKSAKLSGEQLETYFERILESGQRMQKLVESLLNLVQESWNAHAGVAEEDLHLVDPVALASQCISLLEKSAQARGQKIVLENAASITRIQADEPRLRQVLEHLITNALHYSPEQTTVTVRIEDKAGQYGIGKQLAIQIIDQGCGVPESEMQAIFEPFYQSSRTATGAGGAGLGLPLCKSIIQRHKGSLTVTNLPQGGALFEIILPQL